MHADAALVQVIRDKAVPDSRLSGSANLLIMPTLDAANIAFRHPDIFTGMLSMSGAFDMSGFLRRNELNTFIS